jgi:hypothetical protein
MHEWLAFKALPSVTLSGFILPAQVPPFQPAPARYDEGMAFAFRVDVGHATQSSQALGKSSGRGARRCSFVWQTSAADLEAIRLRSVRFM